MPDGAKTQIQDIRKQLLILDGYLIKELETQAKRQSAGWLMDGIETSLKGIEKICQKS